MAWKTIGRIKTYLLTWQCNRQQQKWQEKIDIPKDAPFCPLLYIKCNRRNGNDTNCFAKKAPGCYAFRKHLQAENSRALITKKYCLDYLANEDLETIV